MSAYLWMQAFSGGAGVVIRPPSIDAFRRELVPALVDLAEPRRAAAVRAAIGVRVELGRAAGRTDDRLGAVPVVTSPPGPAPEPPEPGPAPPGPGPREPGTPPTAPGAPPAGQTVPEPPSSPGAPDPTPVGGSSAATAGVRPPAAVQPTAGTPDATSAETEKGRKRPQKAAKRERPASAQAARRATPAQPAIPPQPQEYGPTTAPAATPAQPAHSSAHRKDDAGETPVTASPAPAPATEKAEHGHGNPGGNSKKP